jgi:LmbE family N-acetylglucosaminyl deacetylase
LWKFALFAAGSYTLTRLLPKFWFQLCTLQRDWHQTAQPLPLAPSLSSQDRLLILSPHPDDETLGAGGLISQARHLGVAVRVVFLTNGDGSGSTQIAETVKKRRKPSFLELAAMRQCEATAAVGELGVASKDIVWLGYPDGGTGAMWRDHWKSSAPFHSSFTRTDHSPYPNSQTTEAPYSGESALRDVKRAIEEFRPTRILTTDSIDTHPDHSAAYGYARAALEQLRLQSSTRSWAEQTLMMTFLVHHGIWPMPHGYFPDAVLAPPAAVAQLTRWTQMPLDATALRAKKSALEQYVSQLVWTPLYLRSFLRANELFNHPNIDHSHEQSSTHSLLRDAVADSHLRTLHPAADLSGVSFHTDAHARRLNLRLETAAAPSPQCSYELLIHVLSTNTAHAWSLEFSEDGDIWSATMSKVNNSTSVSLTARVADNALEVEVPYESLQIAQASATLLLAARTPPEPAHYRSDINRCFATHRGILIKILFTARR